MRNIQKQYLANCAGDAEGRHIEPVAVPAPILSNRRPRTVGFFEAAIGPYRFAFTGSRLCP